MINYLLFLNLLGAVSCAFDKYLATFKKYRISEKILLGICFLGGVFGFYIMSRLIRHKTKDKKFLLFLYPIFFFWIFVLIYLNLC